MHLVFTSYYLLYEGLVHMSVLHSFCEIWVLSSNLLGKEPACQCRRCRRCGFDPWVWKIPGEGNGNPLQYACSEKSCGQRSLVGYSPWGHTACLSMNAHNN